MYLKAIKRPTVFPQFFSSASSSDSRATMEEEDQRTHTTRNFVKHAIDSSPTPTRFSSSPTRYRSSPTRFRSSPMRRLNKPYVRSTVQTVFNKSHILFMISFAMVILLLNAFNMRKYLVSHDNARAERKHTERSRQSSRVIYLSNSVTDDRYQGIDFHKYSSISVNYEGFDAKLGRIIDLGSAVYSDVTQTYPAVDSSDTVSMEKRFFPQHETDESCVPMAEWQKKSHPSCNNMHEINFPEEMKLLHLEIFATKGFWRHTWMLKDRRDCSIEHRQKTALKTIKYEHDLEEAYYENSRVDALAMERLTSSPYVIDVYGFCAMSVLTDYAGESFQSRVRKAKPVEALTMSKQVAEGLAALHGIDGDAHASFVHNDLNIANILIGKLNVPLINDFNIGILTMKNKNTKEPCGFTGHFPNPQWKSPEEQVINRAKPPANLTEKIDIYALGNIYFKILTGHSPWHINKGKMTVAVKKNITQAKLNGRLPPVPEIYQKSNDKFHKTLIKVITDCYKFNPFERPNAKQIAKTLDHAIKEMG